MFSFWAKLLFLTFFLTFAARGAYSFSPQMKDNYTGYHSIAINFYSLYYHNISTYWDDWL